MENSNKSRGVKLPLIIAASVVAFVIACIFWVQSFQNRAIGLEESIFTAQSDIKVQEKSRQDKIYNLADCVMQYDSHESNTLTSIASSMSPGDNLEEVNNSLAAVVYQYPELKSDKNYRKLMQELVTIENTLAKYRENYNRSVDEYRRYCRRFPRRNFLELLGYEVRDFQRLDYDAPVDAPTNLFDR